MCVLLALILYTKMSKHKEKKILYFFKHYTYYISKLHEPKILDSYEIQGINTFINIFTLSTS
jgi:hypothetical protein